MKAMFHRQRAKDAEAALCDREHDLSQLADMVPSHIWRLTTDGEPILVEFLGLDAADTDRPGMTRLESLIKTIIHPEDAWRNAMPARTLRTRSPSPSHFFTTKPHGTGMRLAICRSIIEGPGSRLWLANNESRGATVDFTVRTAAGEAS